MYFPTRLLSDQVVKDSTSLGDGRGFSEKMRGCLTESVLAIGFKCGRGDLGKGRRPSCSENPTELPFKRMPSSKTMEEGGEISYYQTPLVNKEGMFVHHP